MRYISNAINEIKPTTRPGRECTTQSCIVSYTGETLDYKAPLLKALHELNQAAVPVCQYFDKNVTHVFSTLGIEQEYFLVDIDLYNVRPDLEMTGRTLFGATPAKGQQLEDHYFGSIPARVYAFMVDFEVESFKLGIPLKTRHNEVAPSQFECAPVFEDINLAEASGTPPVGGHGDVLFKIRTKDNLVTNDTVLQRAGIYFDYNAPVATNDAETIFATLNNPIHDFDDSVKVYPNPAHTIINISCNTTIQSIALYDIQGRLLETDLANNNEVSFDISDKSNGVYFIKITSDKGSKVEKIVKE